MKQKDIAMIIMVAFISGMFSFFLTRAIFAKPQDKKQEAEIVEAISSEFKDPSAKFFNTNSVNPTYQIQIGDSTNTQPFNATQ